MFTAHALGASSLSHSGFKNKYEALNYISGFIPDSHSKTITFNEIHSYIVSIGGEINSCVFDLSHFGVGGWVILEDEDYRECDGDIEIMIKSGLEPPPEVEEELTPKQKQMLEESRKRSQND
jgi:hypothetical protein